MANPCPKCGNELRPGAKFCDDCGAPVDGSAPQAAPVQQAPAAAPSAINWNAIVIIVVVLAVLGWLLFGKNNSGNTAGNSTANANAATDSSNPHSTDQGMGMEDVTSQIANSKDSLDKNPLDTQALATLYRLYGMIGRQNQVTPYVDKALTTLDDQKDSMGKDKTEEILRGIVGAALGGNDIEAGLKALERYAQLDPNNTSTLVMLGNLNYDLNKADDAIKWYGEYLDLSDPATDGDTYWNAKADRAAMYLQRYDTSNAAEDLNTAMTELQEITTDQPKHWGAWYNLGQANLKAGNNDQAEAAFEQAKALGSDDMEVWQAEAALAKMHGEEPPPKPTPPSNPHGGSMGATPGTPNPHGSGMSSPQGMPNPHGSGAGGA